MRRFITSLPGKIFSHLVVLALLLPSLSLVVATKATAQVTLLPTIAVVQFGNLQSPGTAYGQQAAEAVTGELVKTGQYTVTSQGAVGRAETELGMDPKAPIQGTENILRIGQNLRVQTIIAGDVVAYKINNVGGGRQARVAIRLVAYDVNSGLPINGAAVPGDSIIRTGSVTDDTLIGDGIMQGAATLVRNLQTQTLPTATILNTLSDRAFINQGSRSGFQTGMEVVISRGRQQVAVARVSTVEPDQSTVMIERSYLGVSPGDKVRAVANIPNIDPKNPWTSEDTVKVVNAHPKGNNAGLVSVLLVVGLVAALLGGEGGNTQDVLSQVQAEATLWPAGSPNGTPAVFVTWRPTAFAGGNTQQAAWQVWRTDYSLAPVEVVQGPNRGAYDVTGTANNTYTLWTNLNGIVGTNNVTTCQQYDNDAVPTTPPPPPPTAGVSYQYQVELIYGLSSLDLPISQTTGTSTGTTQSTSSSSTTGTTSSASTTGVTTGTTSSASTTGATTGTTASTTGTTASTGTTSSTTGTTATTGATECYFASARQAAKGLATATTQPVLLLPGPNTQISTGPVEFSWSGPVGSTRVDYVLQVSTQDSFPPKASETYTYSNIVQTGGSTISGSAYYPTIYGNGSLLPPALQNASKLWWRIGAKFDSDSPGPVQDPVSKLRYVFSQPQVVMPPPNFPTVPSSSTKKTTTGTGHKKGG